VPRSPGQRRQAFSVRAATPPGSASPRR
jgi:hypothetical protein